MPRDKRKYDASKDTAQQIVNKYLKMMDNKRRQAMENNPANIRNGKNRLLLQMAYQNQQEHIKIDTKTFLELSEKLNSYAIEELRLTPNQHTDVDYETTAEFYKYYKSAFNNLKELSDRIPVRTNGYSYYDKFLLNLIRLNIRFVYFAPKTCFGYTSFAFTKIPLQERIDMLKPYLEKLGVWEDEKFQKLYGSKFEDVNLNI